MASALPLPTIRSRATGAGPGIALARDRFGSATPAEPGRAQTLATVRRAVRSVVEGTPELRGRPELAQRIAKRMVEVSMAAANLIAEEQRLDRAISTRVQERGPQPLATAQAAGDIHRRTAVSSAADVLRATRDAIDFPGFVTSLITGVFQSIQTSNIQQLQAFSDLLEAVNATTEDFGTTQIGDGRAAQWVASRWSAFVVEADGDSPHLVLRDGSEMPAAEEIARAVGASASEAAAVSDDDLDETLLPLVRRKLARDRQSMLSTMVLMGLQRVVVDDGHLHASMRLQVDARSIAEQRQAEQFDSRVETEASGSFGMGAWGASAKLSASVGYVKSDDQFSREDIAVQAGLRSSVDLRFRTLPLDLTRMASDRTLDKIRDGSRVPEAEHAVAEGGSLLTNDPTRVTRTPTMPTPTQPGSLISQDRGTMAEAIRRAQEARESENDESESGGTADTAESGGAADAAESGGAADTADSGGTTEPAAGEGGSDASGGSESSGSEQGDTP